MTVPWRAMFAYLTHEKATGDETLGHHSPMRRVASPSRHLHRDSTRTRASAKALALSAAGPQHAAPGVASLLPPPVRRQRSSASCRRSSTAVGPGRTRGRGRCLLRGRC
jgi:hypothetical protein